MSEWRGLLRQDAGGVVLSVAVLLRVLAMGHAARVVGIVTSAGGAVAVVALVALGCSSFGGGDRVVEGGRSLPPRNTRILRPYGRATRAEVT